MISAPNSLIHQPDSYYGSYIDDSFVGDFVGDYPDVMEQSENIMVMDSEGQNLIMMNPNDSMSHGHDLEFDFDSFGPESFIYAGNVSEHQQVKPESEPLDDEQKVENGETTSSLPEENGDEKKNVELSEKSDSGFDKDKEDELSYDKLSIGKILFETK